MAIKQAIVFALRELAKEQGVKLAREKGLGLARAAGEKLVARASATARKRGLADRDVTLDEVLEQLGTLHAQGRLNTGEFRSLWDAAVKKFKDRR